MLPGWNDVISLASLPLVPPNSYIFISSNQRTFLQKVQYLSSCAVVNRGVFLNVGFGAVASSLLSGLSGYVDIGLVLLWI